MKAFIKRHYILVSGVLASSGTYLLIEGVNRKVGHSRGSMLPYIVWEVNSALVAIGIGLLVFAAGIFINGNRRQNE